MKELRDYQSDIALRASMKLKMLSIVYLAMEVRTGKTATALEICRIYGAKKVLFLTKKKAISSIEEDYKDFGFTFELQVINNESLHYVVDNDFDVLISDEHHRVGGSFPKPSKMAKDIRQRFSHLPMIFLSGTPTPESHSQIYHQFWVSDHTPFKESNFYRWAKKYVNIYQVDFGYGKVNNYSRGIEEMIKRVTDPYFLTFTQAKAGFETQVNENVLMVEMERSTYEVAERLKKDRVIQSTSGDIVADTAVKLMIKLHQIYSGTIKFEDGKSIVFDKSKAEYISIHFEGVKIAIFYKFKEELNALRAVFGDNITESLDEFNSTSKNIALQIVSGREGISLRNAKYLVYYNIDFSAVSYFQSRDRMTHMNRPVNDIYWVFSKGGIEHKIYKAVINKKNYTTNIFRRDYEIPRES